MSARTFLARSRSLIATDAAFLTPDAIEVDQSSNYEVVRKRVFFDDVQLVTLHRERGAAFLVPTGLIALLFNAMGIFILAIDTAAWPVALPVLGIGFPALAGFLVRLALGREVVTIYGRRSRVALRFGSMRKQRARDVYGQICAAVRRGQSAVQETPAATPEESGVPLPPPDVPPPPPAQ